MRRTLLLSLSSLLLAGLVTVALAQDEPVPAPEEPARSADPTMPSPQDSPAPVERTPEDLARRARVVARVGEATITVGEVEDAINEQSPFVRLRYRDRAELEGFVSSMIRFELLARAAERAEVDQDEEVRRVVNQNAVQQLIRRDFDERYTVQSVPQAEVEAYYREHAEEFNQAELRRAAHIRVGSREEADRLLGPAREADARAFRELASEHSTDPATRLRGGDLRYFAEDGHPRNTRDPQVDEGLARAAFAIEEVGEVAPEPIQIGEEWSIVKLTGRRPPEIRTIDAAAPTIRLRIWRQTRQQALEDFVARLRREAGVTVDYQLLRPIQLDEPEREDRDEHGAQPAAPAAPTAPR